MIPRHAFLLLWLAPLAARAADNPLNVVVIDVCSARADHFGLYGYSRPTTPNLDGLAKESAVFDRAVAQSSWCLPNYATLFTGHVPEVHGQYANIPFRPLPDFETTLAERLKSGGYATAAFTGGVYFLPAWGLSRGFDTFVNLFSTAADMPGSFRQSLPEVVRWVDAQKGRPFFLYAAVDDLHAPYQSDDPDRYDPSYRGVAHDTDTLSVRFFRAYNGEPLKPGDPLEKELAAFKKDPRALAHLAAHYDSALNRVDDGIARLVSHLKKKGLWDRSIVIITGDHGELLGEHGLLGHTQGLYEPVLHVPMLVHHPGYPGSAGKRVHALVERLDLAPTVLDSAGVDYRSGELQGKSLLPLLADPSADLRTYAYASSKRNRSKTTDLSIDERVVEDKRWKLHWYLYKDRFELYDLENDPEETRDVAKERPEIAARLAFELMKGTELARPHAAGLPSGRAQPGPSKLVLSPPQD